MMVHTGTTAAGWLPDADTIRALGDVGSFGFVVLITLLLLVFFAFVMWRIDSITKSFHKTQLDITRQCHQSNKEMAEACHAHQDKSLGVFREELTRITERMFQTQEETTGAMTELGQKVAHLLMKKT